MSKNLKIYFIRHGETYFNYLGMMQGWSDTPLTAKGHEQAFLLGKRIEQLGDISPNIYSSDMNRAVQTAKEINHGIEDTGIYQPLKLHTMPELREQFYGSFEGKPKDLTYQAITGTTLVRALRKMNPDQLQNKFAEDDPNSLAETSLHFWSRFSRGIETIVRKETKPVVVITHSAIMTALVGMYAPQMLDPIESKNLAVTTVEFPDQGFAPKIISYDRTLPSK